jgi:phenylacetic acid degradation operon negative regulatory protein
MVLGVNLLDGASDGVWQESLVAALCGLGYTSQAARQAIARAAREGLLRSERVGRRSRMHLSEAAVELLSEGRERLFTFGRPWTWDGNWLLVSVSVPEHSREVRHRLRTRLAWAGLGSLGNGLWLSPHVDREREIATVLAQEPAADALTFSGRLGELGDLEKLIHTAWDIDGVVAAYEVFLSTFKGMRVSSPEETFRRHIELLSAWRRFPFIDPDLPPELLPRQWLRRPAYELFHARAERWDGPARAYFSALDDSYTDAPIGRLRGASHSMARAETG